MARSGRRPSRRQLAGVQIGLLLALVAATGLYLRHHPDQLEAIVTFLGAASWVTAQLSAKLRTARANPAQKAVTGPAEVAADLRKQQFERWNGESARRQLLDNHLPSLWQLQAPQSAELTRQRTPADPEEVLRPAPRCREKGIRTTSCACTWGCHGAGW